MTNPLFRLLRAAVRGLGHLAVGLLALLILFEEWGWEPLHRALLRLGRLPVVCRIEAAITRLPPPAALVLLLLPTLGLLPVKLAALWLIARGQPLTGLAVVLVAKLIGTAVLAWLFALTQPALMRMPWFGAAYGRWYGWKEALLAWVRESWAWRTGRVVKRLLRRWVARWQRV
ncbi:hypothetical protein [uncultured Thiodictyon sp.]|uniref:hypothetical protein n=1 Tax=uncultured Thiodictyon sp. TaxID=1846217 RepID=UPI0025F4A458|nr:hypothetical protein [uncultured Thiodictyon sp.]